MHARSAARRICFGGRRLAAVGDVLRDRAGKDERVLADVTDQFADDLSRDAGKLDAAQGRLAAAGDVPAA